MGSGPSKGVHFNDATPSTTNNNNTNVWYNQPPHTISHRPSVRNPQPPTRSRSLGSRPGYIPASGIRESAPDPHLHRSFTDIPRHLMDMHMAFPLEDPVKPSSSKPHNPLPAPPKDIFPENPKPPPQLPRNQYSRVPSIYPSGFVPMPESDLRQMKKEVHRKSLSRGKSKSIPVAPSSAGSGTTAVATSTESGTLTHQRTRSGTMSRTMTPMPIKKAKKKKLHKQIIAAILALFGAKKKKKKQQPPSTPPGPFLPIDPSTIHLPTPHFVAPPPPRPPPPVPAPVPVPPTSGPPVVPDKPISPPFLLSTRPLPPPPPIYFYHPEDPHYGFTTFSPHTILYKKELYPTAEHLYQCMKFIPRKGKMGGDEAVVITLRTGPSHPKDVVLEARKLVSKAREDWKEARVIAMDEILYLKFSQHPNLRAELLATHPAELVLNSPKDPFWGVGPNGAGRNELGQALMRVRTRLRRELNL